MLKRFSVHQHMSEAIPLMNDLNAAVAALGGHLEELWDGFTTWAHATVALNLHAAHVEKLTGVAVPVIDRLICVVGLNIMVDAINEYNAAK